MSEPLLPADLVDRAPETEAERGAILTASMHQMREIREVMETRVTCPCGRQMMLGLAARCHWCGLFFCRRCADRHFGTPETVHAASA